MGKKQHQKDKLYLTTKEWTTLYGGRRANDEYHTHSERSQFKRLPFDHCSLSLQPFKDPYMTPNGVLYDLTNIVPFVQKFGIDPFSGEKLELKQLIKLNFHKNEEDGTYYCPILRKTFNQHTRIVAIKATGNVYSYEAVEQLNLKPNHLFDLTNDEKFTKKDIVEIQNPTNLDKFNINNFYYVKNNLSLDEAEEDKSNLRTVNNETRETLKELETVEENAFLKNLAESHKPPPKVKVDKFNAAHYSTGRAAASFTSTVMEPVWQVEAAAIDNYTIRYKYVNKKGYVRLVTNFGNLNLELHCDQVPKTCDNFMLLCKRGYYDGVKFHRLIKHFMIQGGDPTSTGRGGESAFDTKTFEDEFNKLYSHDGRGILSMANSGPDTNKSQFFITFRSCKHLDNKHTIFGRVVGGLDVLSKIENVRTDDDDKPQEVIKIIKTMIFTDPYKEAEEIIEKERKNEEEQKLNGPKKAKQAETKPAVFRKGVGSFINLDKVQKELQADSNDGAGPSQKKQKTTIGNFDNW